MQRTLTNYIHALRLADVPVTIGEAIDVVKTASVVGYGNRQLLKDSLSIVVAKSEEEKAIHDALFDQYFSRTLGPSPFQQEGDEAGTDPSKQDHPQQEGSSENNEGGEGQGGGGSSSETPQEGATGETDVLPTASLSAEELVHLSKPEAATELAIALERTAMPAGLNDIRFFTQIPVFARRMLDALGIQVLDEAILTALRADDAQATDLMEARERLRQETRAFVEQAFEVFGRNATEQFQQDFLQTKSLAQLDRYDQERMKALIRKMAKRLAAKHSRRRRKNNQGKLDLRKTLRANAGHDGVPFELKWKQRKRERAKIIAICDVSRSVAQYVRFMLMLLYNLTEVIPEIRSYAFSSNLRDVSAFLEDEDFEDAIQLIFKEVGFGSTDYGQALIDLDTDFRTEIDRRTSIVILGDGRSNQTDPRIDLFKEMATRAKRIVWLCPEPPSLWGTGDSEMKRYAPHCAVAEQCTSVRDLARAVDEILLAYAR